MEKLPHRIPSPSHQSTNLRLYVASSTAGVCWPSLCASPVQTTPTGSTKYRNSLCVTMKLWALVVVWCGVVVVVVVVVVTDVK